MPQLRRRAREIALQLVYELDLRPGLSPAEAIEMYPWENEDPEVVAYAQSIVLTAAERGEEIDEILREHIVGWRTERMVAVDRAVLRIALCEGLIIENVPVAVAISEAVELTKMFGTVESSRFVNGVLGRIVRSERAGVCAQSVVDDPAESDS
jgi:N utilization substance protein B